MKRNVFTYLSISALLLSSYIVQSSDTEGTGGQRGRGRRGEGERWSAQFQTEQNGGERGQWRQHRIPELQKVGKMLLSMHTDITAHHNPTNPSHQRLLNNIKTLNEMNNARLHKFQTGEFRHDPNARETNHVRRLELLEAIQNDMNTPELAQHHATIEQMLQAEQQHGQHRAQRREERDEQINEILTNIEHLKKSNPRMQSEHKQAIEQLEQEIHTFQQEREARRAQKQEARAQGERRGDRGNWGARRAQNDAKVQELGQRLSQIQMDITNADREQYVAKTNTVRFNQWGAMPELPRTWPNKL